MLEIVTEKIAIITQMDLDQRIKLIIGGAVVLLVLVVVAVVLFMGRVTTQDTSNEQTSLDSLPILQATPGQSRPELSSPQTPGSTKLYQVSGISLRYPQAWGLLSCSNSIHFEFDPTNPADARITCDRAVKPVTVLVVQGLNCQGDLVILGGKQVLKTRTVDARGDIDYRWCVSAVETMALDITHRVSKIDAPASSSEDYSSQIEEIIKTVTVTPQGS